MIYNLNTLDSFSWIFLITTSLSIFILNTFIQHFFYKPKSKYLKKNILIEFFKKLISTPIDYKRRIYYKTTWLLISLLIIRFICVVLFPNCLSSNYITLDRSNLVVGVKDLLEKNTIVLTTTMDGTTVYLKETSHRPYFKQLNQKLKNCGILCFLETLNRNNYAILNNFANRRLSLISTKQIMTIMATTLCWLLNENALGDTTENKNEILFYKVPVENTEQSYSFGISSDWQGKSKLDQINLL